jgi:hypothetical protein
MTNILKQFNDIENENIIEDGVHIFENAKIYIVNGMLHREHGPSSIIISNKYVSYKWHIKGKLIHELCTRKILEDIYYFDL